MSTATEAKKPPPRGRVPEKLVVEVGGPRNERIHFNPLGRILWGGFRKAPLQGRSAMNTDVFQYPEVPGCRIEVNYKVGCGIIYDPLALDENRELAAQINAVRKRFNKEEIVPAQNIVEDLDEGGLATWTWHLRQLVEHTMVDPDTNARRPYPLARVLEGDIEYQPEGRVLVFNQEPTPHYSKKRRDGFPRYLDEIEHYYSGADEEGD